MTEWRNSAWLRYGFYVCVSSSQLPLINFTTVWYLSSIFLIRNIFRNIQMFFSHFPVCNHITHAFWPRVLGLWPLRWSNSLFRPVRRCFAGRVLFMSSVLVGGGPVAPARQVWPKTNSKQVSRLIFNFFLEYIFFCYSPNFNCKNISVDGWLSGKILKFTLNFQ